MDVRARGTYAFARAKPKNSDWKVRCGRFQQKNFAKSSKVFGKDLLHVYFKVKSYFEINFTTKIQFNQQRETIFQEKAKVKVIWTQ